MSDERRIDQLSAPDRARSSPPDSARGSISDGARRSDLDGAQRSDPDKARRSDGAALARESKPSIERVVVRAERQADRSAERSAEHPLERTAERASDRPLDGGADPSLRHADHDDSLAHPREPRHRTPQPDILTIDEAAELLGVSIKTFNKVLHNENMPARKIGREWKFSRQALIDWVGSGRSQDFYRESSDDEAEEADVEIKPQPTAPGERPKSRRTAGWQIEFD